MNKKLILFLSFLFSLVIISSLTFYFFPRNNNEDNNSQEALIQEEEKEEKKEENNKNEEQIKISNYFSILIIIFFSIIIISKYIIDRITFEDDSLSERQKYLFDFFKSFLEKKMFLMSRIEFFLPLKIISWIHGFEKILEAHCKSREYIYDENEIFFTFREEYERPNLFFLISNFLFGVFIKFFLLSLTSFPFLVIANGLKNFKKKFRWKYLITSPFLFFLQGNILMKITLIIQFLWMIIICCIANYRKYIMECYFLKYARDILTIKK